MILDVLCYPDERLRTVARPVETITPELHTIINNMLETMYAEEGVGLAATQVNIHLQVIVVDISEERNTPQVFINPKIIAQSGETAIEEGCLSVPTCHAFIPRAQSITLEALNQQGEPITVQANDFLAICLQHELDHLKGKLFVDYLSPLKRQRFRQKMEKRQREQRQLTGKTSA